VIAAWDRFRLQIVPRSASLPRAPLTCSLGPAQRIATQPLVRTAARAQPQTLSVVLRDPGLRAGGSVFLLSATFLLLFGYNGELC
jgi:hypothetical protein